MRIGKKLMCALLVAIVVCTASGCGNKAKDLTAGIKQRKTEIAVDLNGDGAYAFTDFGVKVLRECAENGKNAAVSPLSVLSALGMTANGANSETLSQMESVFGMTVAELREYLSAYILSLQNIEGASFHSANSIWIKDNGLSVEKSFLQLNTDYFGAAAYKVPFDNGTLDNINAWVSKNTNGMIPKILDDIDPQTVAVLVNALAFEGEWDKIYEDSQVHERKFVLDNGTAQDADIMFSTEWQYLEDENATGFIKMYKDGGYGFAALLPNEGVTVNEYLATLSGESLRKTLLNLQQTNVEIGLPKFESDYSVDMKSLLKNLGMKDAFDPNAADFSLLGTLENGENIYIDRVLHKTHIDVFERGTKAGAVTAVVMESSGAMPNEEPKRVILDRPFVYMIVDMQSRLPIFMGIVNEVSK